MADHLPEECSQFPDLNVERRATRESVIVSELVITGEDEAVAGLYTALTEGAHALTEYTIFLMGGLTLGVDRDTQAISLRVAEVHTARLALAARGLALPDAHENASPYVSPMDGKHPL